MFCPKCGDEFRDGYTRCPDCELPLVAALPAREDPTEEEELVTVATFPNAFDASAACAALQAAGIPAFAPDDTIGSFSRLGVRGWPEVKVRLSDRDRAVEELRRLGHS